MEIAFLSASEIARELSAGSVHFGITGLDLVHENITDPDANVHIVTPLGFGPADVVVAVPNAWIDVETMADLGDVASDFRNRHGRRLRVATKYVTLTRAFFARHGIADYRIVESAGATEGAPAAGSAELIVDITTTRSTLTANNLKIPGRRCDPEKPGPSGRVPQRGLVRRRPLPAPAPFSTAWRRKNRPGRHASGQGEREGSDRRPGCCGKTRCQRTFPESTEQSVLTLPLFEEGRSGLRQDPDRGRRCGYGHGGNA